MRTSVGFSYTWDPGTVPSMAARLMPAFHLALIRNLRTVADAVITDVQDHAVELQPGHVPYDLIPGGYESGTMSQSLTATLFQGPTYVGYQFGSASAPYWFYVEFGHMVNGGSWWDGYHFFGNAIARHKEAVMAAARLSWTEAVAVAAGINSATRISRDAIHLLSARV